MTSYTRDFWPKIVTRQEYHFFSKRFWNFSVFSGFHSEKTEVVNLGVLKQLGVD